MSKRPVFMTAAYLEATALPARPERFAEAGPCHQTCRQAGVERR